MPTDFLKNQRTEFMATECISYGFITNGHKFSDLKQHPFITSQFPWVKSLVQINWVFAQGLIRLKLRCQLVV